MPVECARYFTCRYLPGMHAQACPLWHVASDEAVPEPEGGEMLFCYFDARRGEAARERLRTLIENKDWTSYVLIPCGERRTLYIIGERRDSAPECVPGCTCNT